MLLNLFLIYSIIRKSPKADGPSEQFQTKRLSLVVAAAPEQDDRDDHQPAAVVLEQIVKATAHEPFPPFPLFALSYEGGVGRVTERIKFENKFQAYKIECRFSHRFHGNGHL